MRGIETDGISDVEPTADGARVRFIFDQRGEPFWVDVPSKSLVALFPTIAATVATVQGKEETVTIEAVSAHVSAGPFDEVILEFENAAGAKMGFQLPTSQLLQLSAVLDNVLQSESGSSEAE